MLNEEGLPIIDIVDADNATGIWAMEDRLYRPGDQPHHGGVGYIHGFGHYHERYVRGPDGRWRIASVRLTRLRSGTVPPQPSTGQPGLDPQQLQASRNRPPGADQ